MDATVGSSGHRGGLTTLHVFVVTVVSAMLAVMGTVTFGSLGEDREHPELAPFMTRIQTFSQKLGYSVQASNQQLAEFYLHEIEETFEEIEEQVPEHDGMPIAEYIREMMEPAFAPLRASIQAKKWGATRDGYQALIQRCNACHARTKHEYIVILPSSGPPVFSQKF